MNYAYLKPCGPSSEYPPSFVSINNLPILKTSHILEYGVSYGFVGLLFCLVVHKSLLITSNFTFRYRNVTTGTVVDFDDVIQKNINDDYVMFSGEFGWNTYSRPSVYNLDIGVGDPDQAASFQTLQRFALYCFPK